MSECRWTYYDPTGGPQTLGLYHGDQSGHVMIYLNEKVVLIDFMVHQSKSYSFIVNENLLKLNLNKRNGKFSYNFEGERIDNGLSTMSRIKCFLKKPFQAKFYS